MSNTVVDDPMLDEEWLATPAERSRLRGLLAALLMAAVCFLGGALVQKHYGASQGASAPAGLEQSSLPGSAGGVPEGLPAGFPSGIQSPDAGASDDAGASGAVIGTVVSTRGDVWVVKDLGGRRHRIHIDDQTEVVRETRIGTTDVRVGDSVDIDGTNQGGQLTAASVTVR
ncbi:MAG TPA: hypothetical protein VNS55_09785 [Nocardioides sp.]|nr:hypothetical protein [Nocardioides sp.]